jgi:hypothetical protein
MATPIEVRGDFTRDDPRRLARGSQDGNRVRRLPALAAIYDGGSRTEVGADRWCWPSDHSRLGGPLRHRGSVGSARSQGSGKDIRP